MPRDGSSLQTSRGLVASNTALVHNNFLQLVTSTPNVYWILLTLLSCTLPSFPTKNEVIQSLSFNIFTRISKQGKTSRKKKTKTINTPKNRRVPEDPTCPELTWATKKSSYYTSHYTAFLVEILLNGLLQSLSPKSTSTLKFTVPETTKFFSLLFYCFFIVLGRSKQRSVETTLAWPRSAAAANAAAADAGASPGQPIVASKPWLANTQWYLAFGQAYKIYKCSIIASIDILDILLQHIQCAKLQRWFSKVSQNSKRLQFHCFTRQSQEAKPDLIHYTSL